MDATAKERHDAARATGVIPTGLPAICAVPAAVAGAGTPTFEHSWQHMFDALARMFALPASVATAPAEGYSPIGVAAKHFDMALAIDQARMRRG